MKERQKTKSTGRRPSNLIYANDDPVPPLSLVVLGLEHAALLVASLTATIFFARAIGADPSQTEALVDVGLIAGGIASILQAYPRYGVGSGYFCLHTSSFIYFQPSVLAAGAGGLPLVFGMTAVAGFFEAALSRVAPRLRSLFPPEVSGVVVATVGISLTPYAVKSLAGMGRDQLTPDLPSMIVGLITMGLIVGLNVWASGQLRLYSILIGIGVGYLASYGMGIIPPEHLERITSLSFVELPNLELPHFSFDAWFLVPFLIAAVCASLKLTGDITTCQKINDAEWKRVDMNSVGRAFVADGLGTAAAGLLGGTGLASSSSNIGMAYATGATSRLIGYATGIIFIALSFMPQVSALLTLMPRPVIGAITMYSSCFMIVTGWSIVMTRMLDSRKTFVTGLALMMAVSVETVPELYHGFPVALRPIFGSSLALATVTAIILNLIFRIGISSRITLELEPSGIDHQKIYEFFENAGGSWGARKEVVYRAMSAMSELYQSIAGLGLAKGKITTVASFDEFNLDLDVRYEGVELQLSETRPQMDDILEDEDALAKLSGFLVRQYADRTKTETSDGRCRIQLQFEH
ncbi:MAG: solute carrier family 23 protein [Syntrophobacter sp.]